MNTLFLTPNGWDLAVDSNGNIAIAQDPYSMAQDAASAIRTFLGEVYFNTTLGIPYFTDIFDNGLPLNLYRAQCIQAALTVPGIVSAQVYFTSIDNRSLVGQVQITTSSGVIALAQFTQNFQVESITNTPSAKNTAIVGQAIVGLAIVGTA